jgi:hypothetical protein
VQRRRRGLRMHAPDDYSENDRHGLSARPDGASHAEVPMTQRLRAWSV